MISDLKVRISRLAAFCRGLSHMEQNPIAPRLKGYSIERRDEYAEK